MSGSDFSVKVVHYLAQIKTKCKRSICESTGTGNLREAEEYLARRIEEIRQARVYGVRPERTFRQAATKYLEDATESGELRSLDRNAQALRLVDPFIGHLSLTQVHMGTIEPYIRSRRKQGTQTGHDWRRCLRRPCLCSCDNAPEDPLE